MGWHVSVVLVVVSLRPIALLVHVGVVRVRRRHRVKMVRCVVSSRSLARPCRAIGR